jgi:hypothetical protein
MEICVASTARKTRSVFSYSLSCQLEIYGLVPKRMSTWATPSIALRLNPAAARSCESCRYGRGVIGIESRGKSGTLLFAAVHPILFIALKGLAHQILLMKGEDGERNGRNCRWDSIHPTCRSTAGCVRAPLRVPEFHHFLRMIQLVERN